MADSIQVSELLEKLKQMEPDDSIGIHVVVQNGDKTSTYHIVDLLWSVNDHYDKDILQIWCEPGKP